MFLLLGLLIDLGLGYFSVMAALGLRLLLSGSRG
jgi:hypothetical protein